MTMSKNMKAITYLLLAGYVLSAVQSCEKSVSGGGGTTPPPTDSTVDVVIPTDPETAGTIGFFLDEWQPKTFVPPAYTEGTIPAASTATITIDASSVVTKIPATLNANNANIWMGDFTDGTLLNHMKNQPTKIIRFPGGSISDVFFWNAEKDARPADAPASLLNAGGESNAVYYWYGKNTESWTCSVDKYYSMLQQTGNQGMITVNYGYARYGTGADPVAAAAHLAAEWVRYDNGRTKYWEIGNENFGDWEAGYRINTIDNKDNQPEFLTGELYGKHASVFIDSMKKAAMETGATIYIGTQLLEHTTASWETTTAKTWNQGVLPQVKDITDYYIVHNYYTPYNTNSSAAEILATATTATQSMVDVVAQAQRAAGATAKPLAMTEYNIFATGSQQMVSHIAGMHAVRVIGELMKQKFGFAARWDLANGWSDGNDHGLYNNGDEPGASKWNPRPAFYYLYYFSRFLGDRYINSTVTGGNGLVTYASTFSSGQVGLTIVNESATQQTASFKFKNFNAGKRFYWYTLTGGTESGEFSRKVFVNGAGPAGVSGGPADYTTLKPYAAPASGGLRLTIPGRSVINIVFDKK